jgi:hypothetical protein
MRAGALRPAGGEISQTAHVTEPKRKAAEWAADLSKLVSRAKPAADKSACSVEKVPTLG